VEPPCGQPAVEGCIDKGGEVFRVENLAGNGNRRGAGDKLGGRELALRVTADRRKDILAILLEPAPRESIGIEC